MTALRLWKGTDGCLYARLTGQAAGVLFLVPYVGTGEQWGRWEPSTAENLARAAQREPAAVNFRRRSLEVGNPLPDFEVRDTLDRPVSLQSLRGKTVLFCTASTRLNADKQGLPRLQALYQKYHPLGLEIVMLWASVNSFAEVVEYTREKDLPWIHYAERYSGRSKLITLLFRPSESSGMILVDPAGRVAAVNLAGESLEQAIVAQLTAAR